jgi:hypothetical protein
MCMNRVGNCVLMLSAMMSHVPPVLSMLSEYLIPLIGLDDGMDGRFLFLFFLSCSSHDRHHLASCN